jgi:iron(III) transport system substrate-binding protein
MKRVTLGRKPAVVALALAVLAAAGALAAASGDGGDALVVYNGRSHYGGEAAFKRFEKETGIEVKLFPGEATELYERLRNEGSNTPADVLVTVDGANLWLAEKAGLLAPLRSATVDRNVPATLRDPDGEWVAVSRRVRTIMRSTERVRPNEIATYADLGDPRWRGRLCLRTSNNIYNQSFVASTIAERGEAATEKLLRSWMANDPQILGSDVDVLNAIADDRCDVGLTNHYYLARELADDPEFPVAPVWANQDGAGAHANISGAGVVAASDRKADAARLVAYLTEPSSQRDIAANGEFPANPRVPPAPHIRGWKGFKTDPMDVAAAGREQKAAVQLMARVGWE